MQVSLVEVHNDYIFVIFWLDWRGSFNVVRADVTGVFYLRNEVHFLVDFARTGFCCVSDSLNCQFLDYSLAVFQFYLCLNWGHFEITPKHLGIVVFFEDF